MAKQKETIKKIDPSKEVNYLRGAVSRYKDLLKEQPCIENAETVKHLERALAEQITLRAIRKG